MLHIHCKAGAEVRSARWSTVKKGFPTSNSSFIHFNSFLFRFISFHLIVCYSNHLKSLSHACKLLPREGHEPPQSARPTIAAAGPATVAFDSTDAKS